MTTGRITAGVIALIALLTWGMWKADKQARAKIDAKCNSYMIQASTRSDSLYARIACDQLWATKSARDAADAAAIAAAAALGAASAARIK